MVFSTGGQFPNILCCASILNLAAWLTTSTDADSPNGSGKWESSTSSVVAWTPGEMKKRILVEGEEVTFRIVNGEYAQPGDTPYQISLRARPKNLDRYASFCGAVIISPQELLSAAHCFRTSNSIVDFCCKHSGRASEHRIRGVYAVAGTLLAVSKYHPDGDDKYGQWRLLRAALYPTDFSFPKNDIAVVFLTSPFVFTNTVKPIPYAMRVQEYRGSCLASGYGRKARGARSQHLKKGELRILTTRQCKLIHGSVQDMSKFVCTSDEFRNIGKGDSGGPLVCRGTGDPAEDPAMGVLVGIVSGVKTNVHDGAFFTRVASYREFINHTIHTIHDAASRRALAALLFCVYLLFILIFL